MAWAVWHGVVVAFTAVRTLCSKITATHTHTSTTQKLRRISLCIFRTDDHDLKNKFIIVHSRKVKFMHRHVSQFGCELLSLLTHCRQFDLNGEKSFSKKKCQIIFVLSIVFVFVCTSVGSLSHRGMCRQWQLIFFLPSAARQFTNFHYYYYVFMRAIMRYTRNKLYFVFVRIGFRSCHLDTKRWRININDLLWHHHSRSHDLSSDASIKTRIEKNCVKGFWHWTQRKNCRRGRKNVLHERYLANVRWCEKFYYRSSSRPISFASLLLIFRILCLLMASARIGYWTNTTHIHSAYAIRHSMNGVAT